MEEVYFVWISDIIFESNIIFYLFVKIWMLNKKKIIKFENRDVYYRWLFVYEK